MVNNMKKINLLILTVLFLLPFTVKAVDNPKVLTIEANAKGTTIEYNGTTEDSVYAVMCKLYNSDKEEIDLLSTAVDNKTFAGEFTVKEKGNYKVACANYDGGEIKEAKVTVTKNAKDNPNTYDSGIIVYLILIVACITGIIVVLVYKNKKKKM